MDNISNLVKEYQEIDDRRENILIAIGNRVSAFETEVVESIKSTGLNVDSIITYINNRKEYPKFIIRAHPYGVEVYGNMRYVDYTHTVQNTVDYYFEDYDGQKIVSIYTYDMLNESTFKDEARKFVDRIIKEMLDKQKESEALKQDKEYQEYIKLKKKFEGV